MNKVNFALGVGLAALTLAACDGPKSEPVATETETPVLESPVEPAETTPAVTEPAPEPDAAVPGAVEETEAPSEGETAPTQ
ncbi:hypothetical protein CD351_06335 [Erythrobacter sp. KY5]|uniref:hypothetical protein n=1 Tax=Erythrobacter sp. KY5 TaxID=2011159 RepID=UPI000DBF25F1|nr:hypothetical protein [Erythrobacter sp. KY5]AWW74044.1 hypothetical protein CD351_06335 [Erythrobacter sp. KY5]